MASESKNALSLAVPELTNSPSAGLISPRIQEKYPYMANLFYEQCNGDPKVLRKRWLEAAADGDIELFRNAVHEMGDSSHFTNSWLEELDQHCANPHDNLLAVVNHALRAHGDHTQSALYVAAMNGQSEVVKYLLQLPWINIDIADKDGNTVLHNVMKNLTGFNRREVTKVRYHIDRHPWLYVRPLYKTKLLLLDSNSNPFTPSVSTDAAADTTTDTVSPLSSTSGTWPSTNATSPSTAATNTPTSTNKANSPTRCLTPSNIGLTIVGKKDDENFRNCAVSGKPIRINGRGRHTLQIPDDSVVCDDSGAFWVITSKPVSLNRPSFETRGDRASHGATISSTPLYPRTLFTDTIDTAALLVEYGARLTLTNKDGKTPIDLIPTNSLYRHGRWAIRWGLVRLRARVYHMRKTLERELLKCLGAKMEYIPDSRLPALVPRNFPSENSDSGLPELPKSGNTTAPDSGNIPLSPPALTLATSLTPNEYLAYSYQPYSKPTDSRSGSGTVSAVATAQLVIDAHNAVGIRDVKGDALYTDIMGFLSDRMSSEQHFTVGSKRKEALGAVVGAGVTGPLGEIRRCVAERRRHLTATTSPTNVIIVDKGFLTGGDSKEQTDAPTVATPMPASLEIPTPGKKGPLLVPGTPEYEAFLLGGPRGGKKNKDKAKDKKKKKKAEDGEDNIVADSNSNIVSKNDVAESKTVNLSLSVSSQANPATTKTVVNNANANANATNTINATNNSNSNPVTRNPNADDDEEPVSVAHVENEFDDDIVLRLTPEGENAMAMVAVVSHIVAAYAAQSDITSKSIIPHRANLAPLFGFD